MSRAQKDASTQAHQNASTTRVHQTASTTCAQEAVQMTRAQQVVHVIRKDLLMLRWYALALAATVATLTAMAIKRGPEFDSTWGFFVVLASVVGTCLAIQSDAPCDTRAFWASRPVSPETVAAAKLVDVLLIVMVVHLVATMVLTLSRQNAMQLPALISDRVWLLPGLVASAAALAALTTDLRSFLVAAVVVSVVLAMMISWTILLLHPRAMDSRDTLELFFFVLTAGSMFVVFKTYRTRSRVLGAISAFLVVLLAQSAAVVHVISTRTGV